MENARYLDCLAADYAAMRAAAITAGLGARVPGCPDWTVADLLEHVATVYLHKVAVLRERAWPRPWPPDFSGEDPVALLDRGYRELTGELRARPASEPALTFYEPEQTVRFWLRRMAQETAIHRVDAEQAAGVAITPVPDDLGGDGVDELLKVFLVPEAAGWPDEFEELPGGHLASAGGRDIIAVKAASVPGGARSWTIRPGPRSVTVTDAAGAEDAGAGGDGAGGVRVTLSGPPGMVLRWMWGRADDGAITIAGDPAWADYLRRMLVPATQLPAGGRLPPAARPGTVSRPTWRGACRPAPGRRRDAAAFPPPGSARARRIHARAPACRRRELPATRAPRRHRLT
jgi:uncharacterized protein (TIGR03083 family)